MQMADSAVAIGTHLTVSDIGQSMATYEKIFGFKRKMMLPGPGGKIMHGEMTYKGCTLMLGPESIDHGMKSPKTLGGTGVSLFVYVPNVDETYEKAQQNGSDIKMPISDQFFGCRTFVMHDPDGHQWMVAEQKEAMTPEQISGALDASREADQESQHI